MDYVTRMKAAFDDELNKIAEEVHQKKEAGVPKGLKQLAETALDTAGPISRSQEFAHFRNLAHMAGKEGPLGRGAGRRFKSDALSAKKPLEKTDLTSVNRKVNLRGNGYKVGDLDSDRNYAKFHKSKKKEAGSLQGHVRAGRRPLKVETLLDKEKQDTKAVRKKVADLTKVSAEGGLKSGLNKAQVLGMLGIGAYGMHRAQKINRRYQMGRQLEMQQQQGW